MTCNPVVLHGFHDVSVLRWRPMLEAAINLWVSHNLEFHAEKKNNITVFLHVQIMFYFCALNICELSMRDVRVFTSSERKEMVSLLGATQNEIAKGAMDAWTIVLQARNPFISQGLRLWICFATLPLHSHTFYWGKNFQDSVCISMLTWREIML